MDAYEKPLYLKKIFYGFRKRYLIQNQQDGAATADLCQKGFETLLDAQNGTVERGEGTTVKTASGPLYLAICQVGDLDVASVHFLISPIKWG